MASYSVNEAGFEFARELITKRQYVLDSEWGAVQPKAAQETAYLDRNGWAKYERWFLGLTDGANDHKGAVRLRLRRLQAHPPIGDHRLSLPCRRVAAQGDRARRARVAAADRRSGAPRSAEVEPLKETTAGR